MHHYRLREAIDREAGMEEVIERGQRSLIQLQLTRRGIVLDDLLDRIQNLPIAILEVLAEDLFAFDGLDDLAYWLEQYQ